MSKKLQITILTLLPFSLALLLAACSNGQARPETVRPAMVVQAVPSAAAFEAYSGEVRARHEPQLAFRIGGKIARRHVEVGDRVKAGQVLAELDPDDVRLQVEAMRAQLAAAEADLALARSERDRHQALLDRQLISASLLQTRETAFRAADARVRQVRAQLDVAQNQAGYARLTAPEDGLIAQRLTEAGQVVAAGQTVFVLATEGEREVAIALPEQRIERFAIGQPVLVELWSRAGERVPGRIRELAPAADPASRTFAARVSFDAGVDGTELGQSARVYAARNGGPSLSLPLTAVSAEDGLSFVWVVDPGDQRLRKTLVQLGPFRQDSVPVLSGVGENQWVVAAGVHLLREGQRVQPVDRDNRPVKIALSEAQAQKH
jgi:membrane fusion protein, multidrug efflux system